MLKDCLVSRLDLVICGTAVGNTSAARGMYYAGPGNKFWKILHETGLTPRRLTPAEFTLLPSFGIGLTDIVKGQAGMDSEISFQGVDQEGFAQKILRLQPGVLCFNGKTAAQVFLGRRSPDYGLQSEMIGNTRIFVAPSTSGAANSYWDARHWHTLAQLIMESPRPESVS